MNTAPVKEATVESLAKNVALIKTTCTAEFSKHFRTPHKLYEVMIISSSVVLLGLSVGFRRIGTGWDSFPSVKPQNGYVVMSPEPPPTQR